MKKIIALLIFIIFSVFFCPVFSQSNPHFNGRIQYDFEFLSRSQDTAVQIGNEFRRLYLSVAGKIRPGLSYKMEADFSHARISFRDMYIRYDAGKAGRFSVGSVAEPTSLSMSTSSKYILLPERSMLTSLQNGRWGSGFFYDNFHLLQERAGLQVAVTGKGNGGKAFTDKKLQDGLNLIMRGFWAPVLDPGHRVLHLGFNYANRPAADLSFRPENHMGAKYTYRFPGAIRRLVYGAELAGTLNNFLLEAEYKKMEIPNRLTGPYGIEAFQVTGSFFLTGEHHPYRHGAFVRVKPRRPFSGKGPGAWEVLFRYSDIRFNAAAMQSNITMPGQIANWSFGLNFYPLSHLRLMYAFVLTKDQNTRGLLRAHLFRIHIDF